MIVGADGKKGKGKAKKAKSTAAVGLTDNLAMIQKELTQAYYSSNGRLARLAGAFGLLMFIPAFGLPFYKYSHMFAMYTSSPSLVFKSRDSSGQTIKISDYLDSYDWLNKNTPEDARVLSWWDYGYQISGIANRTTLADGNTWNHEHIALIGRCLTSPEKRAHELVRHLADYVLVWAGGRGDDLDKSPHIARIGNSVYQDICPNDPLCYSFGFYDKERNPTPTMAASLLYKLVMHKHRPGVQVDEELFEEVHTTKYGMVRIYKVKDVDMKSRNWLSDPANRLCDRPGSWYCPGQYPPDLPEKIGKGHATLDYNRHTRGGSH